MPEYRLVNDAEPYDSLWVEDGWVPPKGSTVVVRGHERIVLDIVTSVTRDSDDQTLGLVNGITVLTTDRKEGEAFDGR